MRTSHAGQFFPAVAIVAAVAACSASPLANAPLNTSYANPQRVTIAGYDDDAMEPFITRDGRYLLFNNSNDAAVNTDLHFAERANDSTFNYRGKLSGVNTAVLEGVASVDRDGELYFVSPRSYDTTFSTIYRGKFADGVVTNVELVDGISLKQAGTVNFDVEVSPDGHTLYFVDAQFAGGAPKTASIIIAEKINGKFRRKTNSAAIMQNVNLAGALQYAACISANGLSLFFNRTTAGLAGETAIMLATRSDTSSAFGVAQRIAAISGFVEGAALSPDENSLYYHKKDGGRFVIYRVSRH